jgi:hypothetical protein
MKGIVDVQQALIARLKLNTVLPTISPTYPEEIREREWRGTKFNYPCTRIRVNTLTPTENCSRQSMTATVYTFSVLPSSLQCNQISDEIKSYFQASSYSISGTQLSGVRAEQIGADWLEEDKAWLSIVNLSATTN